MKHFETLWNDAEKIAKSSWSNKNEVSNYLEYSLGKIRTEDKNLQIQGLGELLYGASFLSQLLNLNVYALLAEQIQLNQEEQLKNEDLD